MNSIFALRDSTAISAAAGSAGRPSLGDAFATFLGRAMANGNTPAGAGAGRQGLTAESFGALKAQTSPAQSTPSAVPQAGENDDGEDLNLLQYVVARTYAKSTDAKDAWILQHHAGAIVMHFAGYQSSSLSHREIVDRYLALMRDTCGL